MNIINKAKKFAIKAHEGQIRKSEKEKPMIIHPINVGCILNEYGFDENVVAAGYLHDVVEDTKYTNDDIKIYFGEDIASLVEGASEPDKTLSWEERKTHTIRSASKLDLRHKVVIVADKINNLEDLYRIIKSNKDYSFTSFKRGYESQKWYYKTLCEEISKGETHEIFNRLKLVVDKTFNDAKSEMAKYVTSKKYTECDILNNLKYEIKNMMNCVTKNPFVIEFTGTPRTGKTSIINNLDKFFTKAGYKVLVLEEFTTSKLYSKTIYPKIKGDSEEERCIKILKCVEEQLENALKKNPDIVLIDRSLFDRLIWLDRYFLKGKVDENNLKKVYDEYIPLIKEKINLIIATFCNSDESMKRDYNLKINMEKNRFISIKNLDEYNVSLKNIINLMEQNNKKVNYYKTDNFTLDDITISITKDILNELRKKYVYKLQETYNKKMDN